jgi:membrane protein DedA with SNARE-associated domain
MPELTSYLSDASLVLILVGLVISQLGLPVPEPVFAVALGLVCERQGLPLHVPIWSSCLAVLLGDLLLYHLARAIGLGALDRRPLVWLVPTRVRPRIDALFERHGAMTIFVARFFTGVRFAAFALAGMRRMAILRFILWDGLAILVTVPIFAALGFMFAYHAPALNQHVTRAKYLVFAVLVLVVVGYVALVVWRRRGKRASGATPTGDRSD